jgi:hypothetical protein
MRGASIQLQLMLSVQGEKRERMSAQQWSIVCLTAAVHPLKIGEVARSSAGIAGQCRAERNP